MRELAPTLISVLVLFLAGCGGDGAGADAYREGRFEDAFAELSGAVEEEGDDASATLHYNRALAALRVGEPRVAEQAAEEAARRGGEEFEARREFVLGNAAFAQALIAERQADTPEAEPFAFDVAIRYAERARDSWSLAVVGGTDRDRAARNVERALLKLTELREKKAAAEERNRPRTPPRPDPLPLPEGPDRKVTEDGVPEAMLTRLTPEQVLRLFDKLGEKEREKIEVRKSHRRAQSRGVEKDW
jgi:hypothetical protein